MGIIVDTFYAVGAHIPQAKEKEFHGRLEKLFQAGGMMEINRVSMFGIETATLQKVRMREDGMDFYYNYFEDDFWEPAGFDLKENCVWSNDIGWRQFNSVMIAAYVLENLYSDGVGAVFVSGEMMCEELVNEEFYVLRRERNLVASPASQGILRLRREFRCRFGRCDTRAAGMQHPYDRTRA